MTARSTPGANGTVDKPLTITIRIEVQPSGGISVTTNSPASAADSRTGTVNVVPKNGVAGQANSGNCNGRKLPVATTSESSAITITACQLADGTCVHFGARSADCRRPTFGGHVHTATVPETANTLEQFYQAIQESPKDAGLVAQLAGWLEEQNDPRAQLIRVQLALESAGPFADRDTPHYRGLEFREAHLRHLFPWREPLRSLEVQQVFQPIFKRGLVQAAVVRAHPFLREANVLHKQCPLLRRLELVQVRGKTALLPTLAALAGIEELAVLDLIGGQDAEALAASPYLDDLKLLEIWLGGPEDERVVSAVARLPGLQRLVLHQVRGGLQTGNQARRLRRTADALVERANQQRGAALTVVQRPWDSAFPLHGVLGHGFYAGRLRSGELVLGVLREDSKTLVLHRFNREGRFLDFAEHPLQGIPPDLDDAKAHDRFVSRLEREFRFKLALIWIKEFRARSGLRVHLFTKWDCAVLAAVDAPAVPERADGEDDLENTNRWIAEGNFVIEDRGHQYVAEQDGKIHNW